MFFTGYTKRIFKIILLAFIVYCLIFYGETIKENVISAMKLWAKIIVPSVFPYLIISEYIASANVTVIFNYFPFKLINRIFKTSSSSIKAIMCGILCGYPSGAICASTLLSDGCITKKEAAHLIGFTNNAGPLFLISAVGTSMLKSTADGFAIYIIQLLSACIYGIISARCHHTHTINSKTIMHTSADFCDAVRKSVVTTVNICGFMIVSYVLSGCIMILTNILLPQNVVNPLYTEIFCSVFFEISAGIRQLCYLPSTPATFGLICFAVSWAGISVILQIKSVAKDIVSLKDIIFPKFCQGCLSFIIGYTYKANFTKSLYNPLYSINPEIPIILCMIIFGIYIIKSKMYAND